MWLVGNIGWSEEKDCSLPSGSRCIKSKRTIRFYTFDQHFNSVREAFVLTFLKSCSKGLGECCLVAVRGGGKALFRVERRPVRSRLISENPICLIFNHKPQPIKAEAKLSKQTTLEIFNKNNLSTNYLTSTISRFSWFWALAQKIDLIMPGSIYFFSFLAPGH